MSGEKLAELKNQAVAHHQAGRLAEAAAAYQQVLEQAPKDVDVLHLLGLLAHQSGKSELGLKLVSEALGHDPRFARGYNTLGFILRDRGIQEEAINCYRAALEIKPGYVEARNNLAAALLDTGCAEEALLHSEQAMAASPDSPEVLYNHGNILKELARFDEAAASFERAFALRPGFAQALGNLSVVCLIRGDYARGFELYEQRWHTFAGGEQLQRHGHLPRWQGEPGLGRKLLLWAEQGLGDSLQMVRYLPQVLATGFAEVVLECDAPLVRLFQDSFPQVIVRAVDGSSHAADLQCPLMSLPFVFGTTLYTVPSFVSYLKAPDEARARWQNVFSGEPRHKVGLVWRSGKYGAGREQQRKSIDTELLDTLAEVGNIRWYSLQKDEPAPAWMVDLAPRLTDLAETAAAIEELDLVITVDTAVAHLAGALGKPVWLMLKFDSGNFWLTECHDSPWYPSMQIFRQQKPGDWSGVLAQIEAALK
ncbi:Flp pilus assembly protein TadD, contains TPR repeats [Formivibrio citricus]|uniref:Flp pilus assembly protein TadD, contains TPR repeats n=1 Tax=Formivibrio citricus TaxID=83765 RepID=A0A1I4VAT0_9NEIS|nr:tetratricopeptide repeat protein [Formivibrio citricus]SFM98292.1 Flp pilus assembly protein TadD, contains TPR repeats [Formivibrio citricus]